VTGVVFFLQHDDRAMISRRIPVIRFRTPLMLLAAAGLVMATASAPGQAPASRAHPLDVSEMQIFTDIGSDDKTKPVLVEDFGDTVLEGSAAPVQVHGDPARLERIRAAAMPEIDKPILFGTPEADAIVSALEVFPPDNPWNAVVEDWPLHPNSKNIIDSIGANKKLRYNTDMGYVLVPPGQKKIDVKLGSAAAESDKGPYPVPENTPIEGYPTNYKDLTLDEVQRKVEVDVDRHALVVDPTERVLYEFYQMRKTNKGWIASGAAIFDLKSNKLRPDG